MSLLFWRFIIARGRFRPQQRDTGKSLRVNDQIRISPVRLVDENNEQVGVVELTEAKQRAQQAGLDLVEVAPTARPPVCRVMDYGKWKYQQRKKEQKAKSQARQSELKTVRLRPGTDEHDLNIKTDKAREFLEHGHKVQFQMLFRGRQMAHQDIGIRSMQHIAQGLADISKIEATPKMMGRRMTMLLTPDKKPRSDKEPRTKRADTPAPAPAPDPQPEQASAESH